MAVLNIGNMNIGICFIKKSKRDCRLRNRWVEVCNAETEGFESVYYN